MDKHYRVKFPMRFKILVVFLFVVTTVVSLITFTMANLFHTDKAAYIHDLTSVIAVHLGEETRSLLVGYSERLRVFARVIESRDFSRDQKAKLLKDLFQDFPDLVAVALYAPGAEPVTVYNAPELSEAGLRIEDLNRFRDEHPLPLDRIRGGEIYVENATISSKLPSLTLAMPHGRPEQPANVMTATVRLSSLMRIAGRSKVFETFVVDAGGILLAHTDPKKVAGRARLDWVMEIGGLQSEQSMGMTKEFRQEGTEMVAGLSPVRFGGLVAGVQIPKAAAFLTARELLKNLIWVALGLLILSAMSSLVWSRRITRPIELLSGATKVVAKGQFDIQVESRSWDEIGVLAGSFNQMAGELKEREEALKSAQAALVQSEKMAAFGQIGAGIAHEVKNPLAGILGYAQLSLRKVEKESAIFKNLEIIEKETRRCKSIIDNLMKFARQEKVIFEPTDINQTVRDAAAIVDHQLAMNKVKLDLDLAEDLPKIVGHSNQIQQVLMNLLINAQQAMEGRPGLVKVITRKAGAHNVEIRVQDDGPGIPKEIQSKILEPFFTTKPSGKGTGLGLSVSYGIIREHKGEIRIESEPGQGATFIIRLPVAAPGTERS